LANDHPVDEATVMDDDVGDEGNVSIWTRPMSMLAPIDAKKNKSQKTGGYMSKEDRNMCRSWVTISKIQFTMPSKKEKLYWRKVTQDFYEHRKLAPFKIYSNHGQLSVQKRWGSSNLRSKNFAVRSSMFVSTP
jgi:hypothetical protein